MRRHRRTVERRPAACWVTPHEPGAENDDAKAQADYLHPSINPVWGSAVGPCQKHFRRTRY